MCLAEIVVFRVRLSTLCTYQDLIRFLHTEFGLLRLKALLHVLLQLILPELVQGLGKRMLHLKGNEEKQVIT